MTTSEIKVLIDRADESHQAAKLLLDKGFSNFRLPNLITQCFI